MRQDKGVVYSGCDSHQERFSKPLVVSVGINRNSSYVLAAWKDKKMGNWENYKINKDDEYFMKIEKFYMPYFKSKENLYGFLDSIYNFNCLEADNHNIPRRMINNIERLVTVVNDMEEIIDGNNNY